MLEALQAVMSSWRRASTEVTVAKAREAAAALLSQGLEVTARCRRARQGLAASTPPRSPRGRWPGWPTTSLETSEQNRELLVGLVRTEVDRAAGRLGFVREEELAAVRRHVSRLETQLAEVRAQVGAAAHRRAAAARRAAPRRSGCRSRTAAAEAAARQRPRPRTKKVVVAPEDGQA